MRYTLILFITILFSCSRDQSILSDSPEISFDINGVHYSYIGFPDASAAKLTGVPGVSNTVYGFTGYENQSNTIMLALVTDSLKTIGYHFAPSVESVIKASNQVYSFDLLDVVVTGYSGGTVNGTFSGNLSKLVSISPLVTQPATLTNGVIKNVRVIY